MTGFSIYPRKRKNGKPVYYVRFKNPEGSYSTALSTGQGSRRAAEAWAAEYIQKNGRPRPGSKILFSQYAQGFFDWQGEWAANRRVEGKRISQRHCIDRADLLRLHVMPFLGEMYLNDIDKHKLKAFRNEMFDRGYSGSVINRCLYTIKALLEDAEDKDLINSVPKIVTASTTLKRQKGILTPEEVRQLFCFEWKTPCVHCHPSKPQFMGYTANLLAATTGLRLGELQAITLQDLHLKSGYIRIWRSWDNRLNQINSTTKTGRERNVFIPEKVKVCILQLLEDHPIPDNKDAFLFWGEKKPNEKPAEKKVFISSLFNALDRIGIDETTRKERNITFHSWRYFLNSLLINSKISIHKIQSITGHLTAEMSQHYYKPDDMADVLQITEAIFTS